MLSFMIYDMVAKGRKFRVIFVQESNMVTRLQAKHGSPHLVTEQVPRKLAFGGGNNFRDVFGFYCGPHQFPQGSVYVLWEQGAQLLLACLYYHLSSTLSRSVLRASLSKGSFTGNSNISSFRNCRHFLPLDGILECVDGVDHFRL